MGKFDGILICSDIDGTFSSNADSIIEEENIKAAKYFMDNGGKFTFSTGRAIGYIRNPKFRNTLNTPVCLYNGGMVYDYDNERILLEERMNITVGDFVTAMLPYNDTVKNFYIFDNCEKDWINFPDFASVTEEARLLQPIKVIYECKDVEGADASKDFGQKQEIFSQIYICKSDPFTVEFNSVKASKGKAVKFIKDYIGGIHTAIGIGDNENDIPLIQDADIGVAVGNAPESVKQIADMIVKPCVEYSIKDLVEIIEKNPERFGK